MVNHPILAGILQFFKLRADTRGGLSVLNDSSGFSAVIHPQACISGSEGFFLNSAFFDISVSSNKPAWLFLNDVIGCKAFAVAQ